MYFNDDSDERFRKFLPLVDYAVERQLPTKKKDYWVQATALELAVLQMDEVRAKKYLASSLTCKPAHWMKDSTANNLEKIYSTAIKRDNEADLKWIFTIAEKLKDPL